MGNRYTNGSKLTNVGFDDFQSNKEYIKALREKHEKKEEYMLERQYEIKMERRNTSDDTQLLLLDLQLMILDLKGQILDLKKEVHDIKVNQEWKS